MSIFDIKKIEHLPEILEKNNNLIFNILKQSIEKFANQNANPIRISTIIGKDGIINEPCTCSKCLNNEFKLELKFIEEFDSDKHIIRIKDLKDSGIRYTIINTKNELLTPLFSFLEELKDKKEKYIK